MTERSVPERTAPADAIKITEDGGVKKLIIEQGTGEIPPLHSKCLVHYVGRLASSNEIFMDTRQETTSSEPAKLVAGRGASMKETGLHLAVATMKSGERAHLWISPQYGYGESGNFSFPTIPQASDLIYEIELLDFEPPTEGKEQRDMTYEERLEAAERRRCEGNAAFKSKNYEEALKKYGIALSFIDEDLLIQLQGFHYDKAMESRLPALLNMAACHLKLRNYNEVIGISSQVLSHDRANSKALYRRGVARRVLGQTEKALDDLQAAWKATPGDVNIAKEIHSVKEELREERKAQAKVFKGLIEKASNQGGLYEDLDDDKLLLRNEGDHNGGGAASSLLDQESDEQEMGWFGSVLQALCPFIFGRQKKLRKKLS